MTSSHQGLPVAYLCSRGERYLIILEKKQVRWITVNQTTAPERPYITRSVSHWDNNRDRINTITKKRRGGRAGLEIKMQEKIK